jgi:hypothetical protein
MKDNKTESRLHSPPVCVTAFASAVAATKRSERY